jgi:urea transport system permease protein
VRRAARDTLKTVEARLARAQLAGLVFSGLSLGSILLLAALGLAITYGLMGASTWAHGELIMIGATRRTWCMNLFRATRPARSTRTCLSPCRCPSWWRGGRHGARAQRHSLALRAPLETLLATWGISLISSKRSAPIFGAQNVQVENRRSCPGGVEDPRRRVLPWSRIVIIAFAGAVLVAIGLLLARTRLGLFVRGVTQNRAMASCVGVPTARVDMWAFGLGSGPRASPAARSRRSATWGPTSARRHRRFVHGGGAGRRGPARGHRLRGAGPRLRHKLLESWAGRP